MSAHGYRSDVDGLRAVAILSVVFYHAGLGCPGGYVGVDVFFVISGYLISSLILKDLREGKFSLVRFWERRLRRIFPALAAAVFATLVAGWFLLLPQHLENLGKSTFAQALLSANIYFWRTTNYFGGANEEKPLLHTWSLAVEEQFYLFFPLLLVYLYGRKDWWRPRVLAGTLLTVWAGSLLLAAWGVKQEPFATFFLLPTRAWELMCGALVATMPAKAIPVERWVRELTSCVGLCAILLPVFVYGDTTPFPGLAALPPCLGAALLIWANSPSSGASLAPGRTAVAGILSWRWIVFIGLISYSLYLWHWPVMVFSNYWKTAPLSPAVRCSLVVVSLLLAVISWRYIETPFRNCSFCGTRRGIFLLVIGATSLLLCSGASLALANGVPSRIPLAALRVVQAVKDNAKVWQAYASVDRNVDNISDIQKDAINRLGNISPKARLRFLILGDSHAGCAIPIFDRLGKEYGIPGAAITHQGTPPLFGWKHHSTLSAPEPDQLWEAALEYAQRNKIQDIFLIAYWSSYQRVAGAKELEETLEGTAKRLASNGFTVWVVLDNPTYEANVVKGLVRKTLFPHFAPEPYQANEADYRKRNSALYDLETRVAGPIFLDPTPYFLDPKSRTYAITAEGVPLYFDHDHLTLRGEEVGLLPLLQSVFKNEFSLAPSSDTGAYLGLP